MKKNNMAQSFKNLGQWFKDLPNMDKKVRTLSIIRIICFLFTFPAMFVATMVICAQVAEGMPFYTFWPYVVAIVVALLGIVFGAVAILINRNGAKKRSVMEKTAILLVVCMILTAGLGLIFDTYLPDTVAKTTFGTLYAEDMYHRGIEESRVIEDYIHLFIGLNLLNGNYDGELAYENVKADTATTDAKKAILADESFKDYIYINDTDAKTAFEVYWFDESGKYSELDKELYDFIYNHYVLMDYDFALKNNADRKAFCLALVDTYKATYKQLCKEGFRTNTLGAIGTTGNAKLTQIYGQNYASQDMDGYMPINEDSGIAYVTNGRMTTPLIVRMLLNDSYTYTSPMYDDNGDIIGYDGFMVYLYRPEIASQYTGEFDENGKGTEIFMADDGNFYYAYNTGHVDTAYNWCILDLLGEPMPLAELDVEGMLGDELGGLINSLGGIGGILNSLGAENIEELLEEGLTNRVIATAADGQKLHLNIYTTDDGKIAATLYPQGMKDGYIGYQYMAWLEMGNLLLACCAFIQARQLFYIFGAISMVMILVAGYLQKLIEDRKKMLAECECECGCDCGCDCDGECNCDEQCDCGCGEAIVAVEDAPQEA